MANAPVDQLVGEPQNAYTLASQYFKVQQNLLCPPILRAAYSDRMAWILASMSQLAYDRYENDYDARKLFITKLQSGGFELVKTFNDNVTDTQAFLAKNDQYAVLAFRGTESTKWEDMKIDATASKISVLQGRVHVGFKLAYQS